MSPATVMLITVENWLPNGAELAPWYQALKALSTFSARLVVCRFDPALGTNCRSIPVTARGVESPDTITSKLLAVRVPICTLRICGADGNTTTVLAGAAGVRFTVPVASDAVTVMVPATVPLWNCNCVAPDPKIACIVLAGIVKFTLRPPVENWIA